MTEPPLPEPVQDAGHDLLPSSGTPAGGRRRAARRRRGGCLPILIVVALFCALVAWFARGAVSDVKDMFAGPEDYAGPGSGEVTFVIDPGQSVASMGPSSRSSASWRRARRSWTPRPRTAGRPRSRPAPTCSRAG
ncbi:hypothetical protein [Nocardioides humi]|uniref:hypothetical protein n=1 Tax=Nocardioides humi TaxID=449461 RepID=UPI0015E83D45|nr:hypothetical protein [Nocardioides humi]